VGDVAIRRQVADHARGKAPLSRRVEPHRHAIDAEEEGCRACGQRIAGVELEGVGTVLEGQQLAMDVVAVGEDPAQRRRQPVEFVRRLDDRLAEPIAPEERDELRERAREGARQQERGRAGQ
jgi:hypothetical protein